MKWKNSASVDSIERNVRLNGGWYFYEIRIEILLRNSSSQVCIAENASPDSVEISKISKLSKQQSDPQNRTKKEKKALSANPRYNCSAKII
mmetsp:Transcript_3436/g.13078  ORF Transcript_3436/g.13078 Transcript_3436/m.13078 type:complete len:91 (+) Transcript_3436:4404-4676(+)